jgi:hypothetical protein
MTPGALSCFIRLLWRYPVVGFGGLVDFLTPSTCSILLLLSQPLTSRPFQWPPKAETLLSDCSVTDCIFYCWAVLSFALLLKTRRKWRTRRAFSECYLLIQWVRTASWRSYIWVGIVWWEAFLGESLLGGYRVYEWYDLSYPLGIIPLPVEHQQCNWRFYLALLFHHTGISLLCTAHFEKASTTKPPHEEQFTYLINHSSTFVTTV